MKAPPPIPLAIGLNIPTRHAVATSALTASPHFLSINAPIPEQRPSSAATTPSFDSTVPASLISVFSLYLLSVVSDKLVELLTNPSTRPGSF